MLSNPRGQVPYAELWCKLPLELQELFLDGSLCVTGGWLFRTLVGAPTEGADVDVMCLEKGVADKIWKLLLNLDNVEIDPKDAHQSMPIPGQGVDVRLVYRFKDTGLVVDVIPYPKIVAWEKVDRVARMYACIDTWDINMSQIATDFTSVVVTPAFVRGLLNQCIEVVNGGYHSTPDRVKKYAEFSGFAEPMPTYTVEASPCPF